MGARFWALLSHCAKAGMAGPAGRAHRSLGGHLAQSLDVVGGDAQHQPLGGLLTLHFDDHQALPGPQGHLLHHLHQAQLLLAIQGCA